MNSSDHPGKYIKNNIIPKDMTTKKAAELLGIGRPALSNLLNGHSALSQEMAARLEKVFGAKQQELLDLQIKYNNKENSVKMQALALSSHIPNFLEIKASEIENWANKTSARTELAVLLRKLICSTNHKITHIDFPGYDNAERNGPDGYLETNLATAWIPIAKSHWELGCDRKPQEKAEKDYKAKTKMLSPTERKATSFIFVSPRNWKNKKAWAEEKTRLGHWKEIKAYDASDLEQWLAQSISAQTWLAERIGKPTHGAYTLEKYWADWSKATDPNLSIELFSQEIEYHKTTLQSWLNNERKSPLIITSDSKLESLAYLFSLLERKNNELEILEKLKDRIIVFSTKEALQKLTGSTDSLLPFIPVILNEEIGKGLTNLGRFTHTIFIRDKNSNSYINNSSIVELKHLRYENFEEALIQMGFNDHNKIKELASKSGLSLTVLRRQLATNPSIKEPIWYRDKSIVEKLIPMTFVGQWNKVNESDKEIISFLSNDQNPNGRYDLVEKNITDLLQLEDPAIWAIGNYRGLVSKFDTFFVINNYVTEAQLENFFFLAELILSETDPALDLPEDKRNFAVLYNKSRQYSDQLRNGICETLVLLAIHGNNLFGNRLNINTERKANDLIQKILSPLTEEKLLSNLDNLPIYAEIAPEIFLDIMKNDLKQEKPIIFKLMGSTNSNLFGSSCKRSTLLWALELLAWNPQYLLRVSQVLAKLAEIEIKDNWQNTPLYSLKSIFRFWMPQTAATIDGRISVIQKLIETHPEIAWAICIEQFSVSNKSGHYSHRPKWREDAYGFGQIVSAKEMFAFKNKVKDLVLNSFNHNLNHLLDLISRLKEFTADEKNRIWNIIENWAENEIDQNKKAILRDHIRTRTSLKSERANSIYNKLTPNDVILKYQYLFQEDYIEQSLDEIENENFDINEYGQRINQLRKEALIEIKNEKGFLGIKDLLSYCQRVDILVIIGSILAEIVTEIKDVIKFIEYCLKDDDRVLYTQFNKLLYGFLNKIYKNESIFFLIFSELKKVLSQSLLSRLLINSPFNMATWKLVSEQNEKIKVQYWSEVEPEPLAIDPHEAIGNFLKVKRASAAFICTMLRFNDVRTNYLKKILENMPDKEFSKYGNSLNLYLANAFKTLEESKQISEEEMAHLELKFFPLLIETKYGIPNIEKQIEKSPSLYFQILAACFKRKDSGIDPPEYQSNYSEEHVQKFLRLLFALKHIPGTGESGKVNEDKLTNWIKEVRSLCNINSRSEIGDQMIGKLLANTPIGSDEIWPCFEIREILEKISNKNIECGIFMGLSDLEDFVRWSSDGQNELEQAKKFNKWSEQLQFTHPKTSKMLKIIANEYEKEAEHEIQQEELSRRGIN